MAKKKKTTTTRTTHTTTDNDVIKFCAYCGLVVAAVAALLSFVFSICGKCGITAGWLGRVIGICSTVSQIALLVAVILPAYKFTRGKSTVVKAFFWVAVILLVLGLVGINLAF